MTRVRLATAVRAPGWSLGALAAGALVASCHALLMLSGAALVARFA